MYKKPLLWIIKGGLFLVPFVPLYISRSLFFPYITGKAFVFRTIVDIVFGAWIALAFLYPEYRPKKTPLFWAVMAFLTAVTLAAIFGENPLRSIWSNFERMEGLVAYVHLAAYFVVLSSVFKKNDWIIFFSLFVVSGIIENFYGLSQHFGYLASPQGGWSRVDGTIGNPTYLAAYLIFILAFCLLLVFEQNTPQVRIIYGVTLFSLIAYLFYYLNQDDALPLRTLLKSNPIVGYGLSFFVVVFISSLLIDWRSLFWKYYYLFVALSTFIIIYYTATRGATIALLGGVFLAGTLYLFFAPPSPFRRKARIGVCAFLVFVAVVAGSLWAFRGSSFVHDNPVLSRLTSLSLQQRTIESRFKIWAMGWEGFKERPIFGWGPENYNVVFAKYFDPELWRQEPWFDRSHNIVLDWLINAGAVGFLAFISMLGTTFFMLWQHYRTSRFSFFVSLLFGVTLLVYFVQNLFVFDNIATYISLFALVAYVQSAGGNEDMRSFPASHARAYAPFVLVLAVTLVGLLFYTVTVRPLMTNLNLLNGLRYAGNPEEAESYFNRALSGTYLGRTETVEQFSQFVLNTTSGRQPSDFTNRLLRSAIENTRANVADNPLDPRAYLFLGTLYRHVGLLDEAIQTLEQAATISPHKQQIYFELAESYARKGNTARAVEVSKIAYDLAPQFNLAQMNLLATYILNNQQDEADAILQRWYGTIEVPDSMLVQIYARLADQNRAQGNSERALFYSDRLTGVWRAFVAKEPDVFEHRKRLALVYLVMGQGQQAQEVLNEALVYKPEFRPEAEEFVKQLQQQQ